VSAIERNTDIKIKCHNCGNEYSMDTMRMDSDGKNLVCRNCLERKPQTRQQEKASSSKAKPQEQAMKEYFCKECKYSFSRARHLSISSCPYCGASGSLMIKGSTAKIIADASRMKGDFEFR